MVHSRVLETYFYKTTQLLKKLFQNSSVFRNEIIIEWMMDLSTQLLSGVVEWENGTKCLTLQLDTV